jgi:hypothetical protein
MSLDWAPVVADHVTASLMFAPFPMLVMHGWDPSAERM